MFLKRTYKKINVTKQIQAKITKPLRTAELLIHSLQLSKHCSWSNRNCITELHDAAEKKKNCFAR
jgi:hypothetical protein